MGSFVSFAKFGILSQKKNGFKNFYAMGVA